MMIGRARFEHASMRASVRDRPRSFRAITAYSTSRIEFLVTIPISIRMPMSEGSSRRPCQKTISAMNAPPMDCGSAPRMVSGCRKSWNSSTSTA